MSAPAGPATATPAGAAEATHGPWSEARCTSAMTGATPALGPCRHCGDPSWRADDEGPVHPCCAIHAVEHPGQPCLACAESKRQARRQERRALRS